jgi:hypothetical protein
MPYLAASHILMSCKGMWLRVGLHICITVFCKKEIIALATVLRIESKEMNECKK